MARRDLSARSHDLRASRVAFVHARVVLAERPTSAKPGDEALVFGDGTIEGFVGGTCAESTVREQALQLLASGESLLLRITPEAEADAPGKRVVHNPCLSGGTLELFLQPDLPAPLMVVAGAAPIASALLAIGAQLGWELRPFDGEIPPDATALVVASHGRGEERALLSAVQASVPYIGLVASPKRGRAVLDGLALTDEARARIHTPAGLDIGAATPEEVAISILAEVVSLRPRRPVGGTQPPLPPVGLSRDPVCGMSVVTGEEAWHLDHDCEVVWFCGRGCRDAFAADPASYS
ncbi:MAG: XdhC family protein [Acidimicrobiales bacterium]